MPRVARIDHISFYVSDLKRSVQWYQEVLGLEPRHQGVWESETHCFLGHGEALVALFERPAGESYKSKGMPVENHQAFRLSLEDYRRFKEKLDYLGVRYREVDHQISDSLYFRDPDDYWIELTTYERKRGS